MIPLLKDISSLLGVFFAGLAAWFAFRSLKRLGSPVSVEVKHCNEFLAFVIDSRDDDIIIYKIEFGKYKLGILNRYKIHLNKKCERNAKTIIEINLSVKWNFIVGEEINYKLFTSKGNFSGNTKLLMG